MFKHLKTSFSGPGKLDAFDSERGPKVTQLRMDHKGIDGFATLGW